MTKNLTELTIDGLRQDLLGILTVYWAREIIGSITMTGSDTREEMVAKLVSIDSLTRDLIIRIVALDDNGKGKRTFRECIRLLEVDVIAQSKLKNLHKLKDKYRSNVNSLKTQHRNKNIGHVLIEENTYSKYLNENVSLISLINEACLILDAIVEKEITYNLKVGSQEALINLRSFVLPDLHPLASAGIVPPNS